jgi:hypothetical protein
MSSELFKDYLLPFSVALDYAKRGKRIARSGWNGKNMFVFLEEGSAPAATEVKTINRGKGELDVIYGVDKDLFVTGDEGTGVRMPHLALRAANGEIVSGWLASQTDMLAEDWTVLE